MLKLRYRASEHYKCPRHPRQQYDVDADPNPGCDACRAIAKVSQAAGLLEQAKRRAQNWIARAVLKRGAVHE